MINQLIKDLENLKNDEKSKNYSRFFKTWVWEYWEWDKFYWISVPEQRLIMKKYYNSITINEVKKLLESEYHEQRLIWLLILVEKYKKWTNPEKKEIFDFYLNNTFCINNWDLVDVSAHKIIWNYLIDKDRTILYKLSQSDNLWEKRISIISTFAFIYNNDFEDSIKICKILINDKHDLIHKASGWVLREIWKKDEKILTKFLDENILKMPRTMLRYAIEKFDEEKRQYYLKVK